MGLFQLTDEKKRERKDEREGVKEKKRKEKREECVHVCGLLFGFPAVRIYKEKRKRVMLGQRVGHYKPLSLR